LCGVVIGFLPEPIAEGDEGARQSLRQFGEDQRQSEERHDGERDDAAVIVGRDGPPAAYRRERRDKGEGRGHTDENGKSACQERPVGTRKDERQDGENARTQNREDSAKIGKQEEKHSDITAFCERLGTALGVRNIYVPEFRDVTGFDANSQSVSALRV
jgi:hypothetical protein